MYIYRKTRGWSGCVKGWVRRRQVDGRRESKYVRVISIPAFLSPYFVSSFFPRVFRSGFTLMVVQAVRDIAGSHYALERQSISSHVIPRDGRQGFLPTLELHGETYKIFPNPCFFALARLQAFRDIDAWYWLWLPTILNVFVLFFHYYSSLWERMSLFWWYETFVLRIRSCWQTIDFFNLEILLWHLRLNRFSIFQEIIICKGFSVTYLIFLEL